ncbi:hypothetical protein BC939DRAFT_386750, partial [Gamsiella multidivaricata]|uniref:uncharacterized protein n=1 Tax=Gamsiella multidivaricata TaxID=101098 RepID=UPI002221069F
MLYYFLIFLTILGLSNADPLAYGAYQSGCDACYTAAGCTFGTITMNAKMPAAIVGCNTALGT